MRELLDALRVTGTMRRALVAITIWISFPAAMVGIAAAQAVVEARLNLASASCVAVLICVWAGWTVWHSYLFGATRRVLMRRCVTTAYRRAFLGHIFPGIAIGFSQMLRPSWNGVNLRSNAVWPTVPSSEIGSLLVMVGWIELLGASWLLIAAWRALGAARVGFVREFVAPETFVPLRSGPYGAVRHPLFWSGVLFSIALAMISGKAVAFAMAAVNLCYGALYNILEDRRLKRIFGIQYDAYAREIPHIIPLAIRRPQNTNTGTNRRIDD
jgi:protein-S-isoprenylcysteine O-methyltransferase Ste14